MEIRKLLSIFNLREIEIEIFEKLLSNGTMGATELASQINISRTSVYDLLDRLVEKGLVLQTLKGSIKKFSLCPLEKLMLLIEEKEKDIIKAKSALEDIKDIYQKTSQKIGPRLQIFEGREALQQMMKDMLLYRNITVRAYWPVKKVMETLTPKFFQEFQEKRLERNMHLKVIWPQEQKPSLNKFPFLKTGIKYKRESRLAPKNISFCLGYTIYNNTVRFISSDKENFGFLIESHELAEMMKGQFDLAWSISKPV
ncbi:MarR family transcriptional regulator [Candidatus Parcubacteria bacterium]|nr:MarR family transcriptional regulator [Candidatus Parcubacteria bacterium]